MNVTKVKFFDCHQHTSRGSVGDAICSVSDLVNAHKKNGVSHVCVTEHGNINSFAELFFECKANGLIPVAGAEVYLCDQRDKILELRNKENNKNEITELYRDSTRHAVLIAHNTVGFTNLMKIIYDSSMHFYRKPLITTDFLANHSDGITATTACINGVVGKSFRKNNAEEMITYLKRFKDIFGSNLLVELTAVDVTGAKEYNNCLIMLAKKFGIPLTISNDVHFCKAQDWYASYILHALRDNLTQKDIKECKPENKAKIDNLNALCKETYLKTTEQIYQYWKRNLETPIFTEKTFWSAVENNATFFTEKVGSFIPDIMSKIPRPKDTDFNVLVEEVVKGAKRRGIAGIKEYQDRLSHELKIIHKLKIDSYIDVLYDFVSWTKKNFGVTSMAPGRGSAAASLVLYCLGVTEVDPIKHKLVFERFLDESKIESGSGPDVDLDFAQNIHHYVKEYVCKNFPNNLSVGTTQEYKWKSLIKDVLRFYNISFSEANELTKGIDIDNEELKFDDFKNTFPEVYKKVEELIGKEQAASTMDALHGTMRASGSHPAGVVIGDKSIPLSNCIPHFRYNDVIVSGWDGDTLSDLGYYKYDLLRVSNVQVIDDALSMIRSNRLAYKTPKGIAILPKFVVTKDNNKGVPFDIDIYRDCDLNDPKIYEFANNSGFGYDSIFQFGTNVAKPILKRFKPNCFEHLVALNAVMRPATIRYGATETFLRRAEGIEKYTLHEKLKPILDDTFGVIIYQEQCLQICMQIGGFSSKDANKIRKLLIKKSDIKAVEQYKDKFISVAIGVLGSEAEAQRIWEEIVHMSEYAFCRAHAVCYTMIAVFDMWLKYYYGFEFYTSVLNNLGEKNLDKIANVIETLSGKSLPFHVNGSVVNYRINILPPDITQPSENFSLDNQYNIRFGLKYIKGIKSVDCAKIVSSGGKFSSYKELINFFYTENINKSTVYGLIFCGACDTFGISRNDMWKIYLDENKIKNEEYGFDLNTLLEKEKDLIGINFDLIGVSKTIPANNTIKQVEYAENGKFEIVFQIKEIKNKTTKNGKPYCLITFDGGSFGVFVWDIDKIKKGNIKQGDIVKCIVSKSDGFVHMNKIERVNSINAYLAKQNKYASIDTSKNALIKQDELELW